MSLEFNYYSLGDLVKIKYGKNQKKVQDDENGKYPIYGTGGLMGYSIDYLYDKPSVLIGRKGSIEKVRYIEEPFWTVDTLFYTEVNEEIVIPKFLYYVMSLMDLSRYNEGTSIPSLRTETLNRLDIPITNLDYQKRVLTVLSNIDKKISINEEINRNLYEILINNFNVIFDHEDKDCKLSDIVNIRRGASPRPIKDYISDTGINWLKIADVTGTEMPFIYKIKEKIIEEGKSKSVFIKKGTLVVSNSATPGIPKFIMVDTCVHDGWLVLNGYEDNLRYYLYFLIVKIRKELINLAYGSVFNNLKTDTLKNYEISKPKDDQLDRFNKIAKPIMEKIDSNTKEIMMLSKLRDTLLPKLMSGEIDVSKINCDMLQTSRKNWNNEYTLTLQDNLIEVIS